MYPDAYNRQVKIATAASNVNSVGVGVSGSGTPIVPVSILAPADLKGVASVVVQASEDGVNYKDIVADGQTVNLSLYVSTIVPVPDLVQACCIGFGFFRLVANTNPSADIIIDIHFAAAGDDSPVVPLFAGGLSVNITLAAPTDTVVKSGAGKLFALVFNKPVATGVVTLYDNTAASGTKIGTITTPASPQPFTLQFGPLGLEFTTGLTIDTATAAQDITVIYR